MKTVITPSRPESCSEFFSYQHQEFFLSYKSILIIKKDNWVRQAFMKWHSKPVECIDNKRNYLITGMITWSQEHLKDHLVRAKLPDVKIIGRSESCGKGNCQVCDFIYNTNTFSTKACVEIFKIQSGVLNCNSQKVVYLLKCRICGETPYFGKAKTKFRVRFNNYKSAHRSYRKNVKCHSNVFMNVMASTIIMGLMIGSSH